MLKLHRDGLEGDLVNQPPLGGCVLKHPSADFKAANGRQPPLGGCVLKHGVVLQVGAAVC